MSGLAPKLPLTKDVEDGYELIKDYRELAQQNMKMVVLTVPGERMMNPAFGVGLKTFLFEQSISAVYGTIKSRINEQVKTYLPYIEIDKILITSAEDNPGSIDQFISIDIKYKIKPLELFDELNLTVSN